MKDRLLLRARLMSVLVLALALVCSLRPVSAQGTSPNGAYGFVASIAQLDSVGSNGGAILGLMNFDGAGNVSGNVTVKPRDIGKPQLVISSDFTGTYSSNPDGTVVVTLNLAVGSTATLLMVITDGGQGAQLLSQLCAPCGANVTLSGQPSSLTGPLPISLFFPSARGNVPLSLTGATQNGGGITVYTANAATANGAATCPDGSAGNWQASVPSVTLAVNPDIPSVASTGGTLAGNFFGAAIGSICGQPDFETISGLVTGTVSPGGGTTLVLHAITGAVASGVARIVNGGSLNGSYGYQLSFTPFPAATLGMMNFDGAGNVTGSLTSTSQGGAINFGAFTGTYSINADNTGTINLVQPSGQPGATFAFVLTDGGSQLLLLRTDTNPQFDVAYGTARLQ